MRRTSSPRADFHDADTPAWNTRAACRDEELDLFFPASYTGTGLFQVEEAKAVCRRCPALEACRTWAITTRQADGISGGLTPAERADLAGVTTGRKHHQTRRQVTA